MDITYFGHSSFLLRSASGKIVTDPYDGTMMKHPFPKTDADIVTLSHDHGDHNAADQIEGVEGAKPLILSMPGEYERKSIRVMGFPTFHDKTQGSERGVNTMYKITIDDIDVLHCGDLGHTLKSEIIDEIGEIDILMIPVGGFYTITADDAVDIVAKLEPSVVIPMHYKMPEFNPEIMDKLAPVDDFLEKIGAEAVKPGKKYTIKKSDLTEEDMKVIVMEMS